MEHTLVMATVACASSDCYMTETTLVVAHEDYLGAQHETVIDNYVPAGVLGLGGGLEGLAVRRMAKCNDKCI